MADSKSESPVFLYSPELEQVHYPPGVPFRTERPGKTRAMVESLGLLSADQERNFAPATVEEILAFHSPRYIDAMRRAEAGEFTEEFLELGFGGPETPVFRGMIQCGAAACGATLAGARMLLADEANLIFSPAGGFHHAHPEMAAGFCYFNDIVLACQVLAEAGRRVLFLDIDVHHCDGVQDAFYDRSDVMTISMHQDGRTLFPGTGFSDEIGRGEGLGYTANLPLPPGTVDDQFRRAFGEAALPLVEAFAPDAIVLELGMDGLAGDPLAGWRLSNNVLVEAVSDVQALGRPLLVTGGGGYHVDNCVRGWALTWSILNGASSDDDQSFGMGGIMLESADWADGLRDRQLGPQGDEGQTEPAVRAAIEAVREQLFARHGLSS